MSDFLTSAQTDILAFINVFRDREQRNPTMAEIASHFRWSSQNSAHEHKQKLMSIGVLIARERGHYVVHPDWAWM